MEKMSLLLLLIFFGCNTGTDISEENLHLLNGYWEIEEVIFPDGSTKDYKVNTSVDYIFVEVKKGYRKKVQPKFNGTYDTSNDADLFMISEKEGNFAINYNSANPNGLVEQRTERLTRLSKNGFSVRNTDGLTYNYKRFEPININE